MKKIFTLILLLFAVSVNVAATESAQSRAGIEAQVNIPKVIIQQGAINLTNVSDTELTVDVYSITGQLVKRVRLSTGSVSIEVKSGCYIIKCERWSKKVIVN